MYTGDIVRNVSGSPFSNGSYTVTVDKIVDGDEVWLKETKSWTPKQNLQVVGSTAVATVAILQSKIDELESDIKKKQSSVDALKQAISILS